MTHKTLLLLFFGICSMQFSTNHKYYVSYTEIDYRPDLEVFQITVRMFIDDFQSMLQKGYDSELLLDPDSDPKKIDACSAHYLQKKIKLNIDEQPMVLNYLGKTYDIDQMSFFLEVPAVPNFQTLTVENTLLFELFDDQQNIVRVKTPTQRKSFLQIQGRAKNVFTME